MSLVDDDTLREAWPSLTEDDKVSIHADLSKMIKSIRRVTQDPPLTASINGGTVQDRFFQLDYEAGPFSTIKSFNDWVFAAATRQRPGPDGSIESLDLPEMSRNLLPDTGNIYLTHGDLTPGNLMISKDPHNRKVETIIDWEQAGWYPEHWECCKMLYGVENHHEWLVEEWPDKVVEPFEDAALAMEQYIQWRCP